MSEGLFDIEAPKALRPGTVQTVVVRWSASRPPGRLSLCLRWRTEGRGTEDSATVWTCPVAAAATDVAGEAVLEVPVPPSPWSVHGKYVSVLWRLELSDDSRGSVAHGIAVAVSPIDQPLVLQPVPEEPSSNPLLRWLQRRKGTVAEGTAPST